MLKHLHVKFDLCYKLWDLDKGKKYLWRCIWGIKHMEGKTPTKVQIHFQNKYRKHSNWGRFVSKMSSLKFPLSELDLGL